MSKAVPVVDAPMEIKKDNLLSVKISVNKDYALPNNMTFKISSDWGISLATPVFTIGPDVPNSWVSDKSIDPSSSNYSATYTCVITPKFSSANDLTAFNSSPFLFAALFCTMDDKQSPLGFAALDCSSFLLKSGTLVAKGHCNCPISFEVAILSHDSFISRDSLATGEAFVLGVDNIKNIPVLDYESPASVASSTFVSGYIKLGNHLKRLVYSHEYCPPPVVAMPVAANAAAVPGKSPRSAAVAQSAPVTAVVPSEDLVVNTEGEESPNKIANLVFKYQSCFLLETAVSSDCDSTLLSNCLPRGSSICKEALSSSTFVVEMHTLSDHDLCNRIFTAKVVEEYNRLFSGGGLAAPKKKSREGKRRSSAISVESAVSTQTQSQVLDTYIRGVITSGLSECGRVQYHGTVRCRFEELLSKSNDLLRHFARRRQILLKTQENMSENEGVVANSEDDIVVVTEEHILDVHLTNPSKPLKWNRPLDISMTTALDTAKSELDTVLAENEKTLAAAASDSSGKTLDKLIAKSLASSRRKVVKPRHERFLELETHICVRGELIRPLIDIDVSDGNENAEDVEVVAAPVDNVKELLETSPFTRMVLTFHYKDDEMLKSINEALLKVNTRALPNLQGSIRSYSLTDSEMRALVAGKLDLVCGFSIIDDDIRMIVLEGLAGVNQGMHSMFVDIPRIKPNDKDVKILVNPEVLFPARLYPEFGPDIKRVRVRDKLKKLSRKPEIYNRKQVDEICFHAVDTLMALRRANDLESAKLLDIFPSADSLNKLELLYGEAISRADIDGIAASEVYLAAKKKAAATQALLEKIGSSSVCESSVGGSSISSDGGPKSPREHKRSTTNPRLLPTVCDNPDYEDYLRTRPVHRVNYIEEQKQLKRIAWEAALVRAAERKVREEELIVKVLGDGKHKVYGYSQQRCNFRVKAVDEMRQRLSQVKQATFTYSENFISQTVPLVDEKGDKLVYERKERESWMTKGGFQYPKPRSMEEILAHPKRPTDIRIEDLKQPYVEKKPDYAIPSDKPLELVELERKFTTRTKIGGPGVFGMLQPVQFEQQFDLSLIGNRTKLPRGKLTGGTEKDPDFFRSVFIGGDELAKLIEEGIVKEKEEWKKKVIVDSLSIKIDNFNMGDKVPFQLARLNDILHGEPKKHAFKHIRHLKSPNIGMDWSYSTTPFGIMAQGPYNESPNNLVQRVVDKTKWKTATAETIRNGKSPADFVRILGEYSTIGPKTVFDHVGNRKHMAINDKVDSHSPAIWEPVSNPVLPKIKEEC